MVGVDLDTVAGEDARLVKLQPAVERRLPAELFWGRRSQDIV